MRGQLAWNFCDWPVTAGRTSVEWVVSAASDDGIDLGEPLAALAGRAVERTQRLEQAPRLGREALRGTAIAT